MLVFRRGASTTDKSDFRAVLHMRGSLSQVLDFSWDYVTSLFWARYPNPYA